MICTVQDVTQVDCSSTLNQRTYTTALEELHSQLLAHWKPIWQASTDIPHERWSRIIAFTRKFLPQCDLQLEPITMQQWRRAVKKLKSTAARGTDGISKADLLYMTDEHTQWLLCLLDRIETGQQHWPKQWLTGIIHAIAKHDSAHTPGDFRPIHLFVITYRLWASIRTKQTLRKLQAIVPESAFGFLPGRETTQVWMAIQAWVEHAVNFDLPLCGLSTDLKKCFNHIERPQIFLIAEHLGASSRIIGPWKLFLQNFERRFCVRNSVGTPELSTRGVAEGDPLSILAMVQINWCHHAYLEAYHPKVSCRSFVDNICLMAQQVDELIAGMAATITCFDLWGLSTDASKTYVWAADAEGRKLLKAWDYAVQYDARELGGSLSLCKAVRNSQFKQRGYSLEERWQLLYRSMASVPQKLMALYTIFWPAALHGAAAVLVSDHYVHELRLRAIKALKFSRAGTNTLLKLTLYDKPLSDPGFFQHWLVMHTFQRMLRKWDDLLPLWRIYLSSLRGKLTPGPFCKLLHCAQQLGWSFQEPPLFFDHFGARHNLQTIDSMLLDQLLEDAWMQFLASSCKHKTMRGLQGMSTRLTRLDHHRLSVLDRARVSALQAGTFMTKDVHAKYDQNKTPLCDRCNEVDDRRHWLCCPRYSTQRLQSRIDTQRLREMPDCLVFHLLVPKLPSELRMRQYLHHIPKDFLYFEEAHGAHTYFDLFTDGVCRRPFTGHSIASWAIFNATTGQLLAAAPLSGMRQCIARAELTAILGALTWANRHQVHVRLWSDAKAILDTVDQFIAAPELPLPQINHDLWLELVELLRERSHLTTQCRWVPSHLAQHLLEDEFEFWASYGNEAADRAANSVLDNMDPLYKGLEKELCSDYVSHTDWLTKLRKFYLLVAETDNSTEVDPPQPEDSRTAIQEQIGQKLVDDLPLSWWTITPPTTGKYPPAFLTDVIAQLLEWEQMPGNFKEWSDAEIVFIFLQDTQRRIPVKAGNNQWKYQPVDTLFERPTFAKLLRVFSSVLDDFCSCFELDVRVDSVATFRFHTKVKGMRLSLPPGVTDPAHERLSEFTAAREIRHSRDLARPC